MAEKSIVTKQAYRLQMQTDLVHSVQRVALLVLYLKKMNILVNGEHFDLIGEPLLPNLLCRLELADQRVAVEVNREIIPHSEFNRYQLNENDRVEIIQAVGGG